MRRLCFWLKTRADKATGFIITFRIQSASAEKEKRRTEGRQRRGAKSRSHRTMGHLRGTGLGTGFLFIFHFLLKISLLVTYSVLGFRSMSRHAPLACVKDAISSQFGGSSDARAGLPQGRSSSSLLVHSFAHSFIHSSFLTSLPSEEETDIPV